MKHLSAKGDYQDLTDEDQFHDKEEALTAFDSQGTLSCCEGTRIEHIPELEHHEDSEKQTLFMKRPSVPLKMV